MKLVAWIPAWKGSKRIPNKNIIDLFDKPLISCPNKLFPADFSHGHKYVPFSSFFYKKFRFSPTIPWSKENFLSSPFEIKNFLKRYNKN